MDITHVILNCRKEIHRDESYPFNPICIHSKEVM